MRKTKLAVIICIMSLMAGFINAQTDDLMFIHHSCGQNWLDNSLRTALDDKSYIDEVNEITYGTVVAPDAGRPGSLGPTPGECTDMNHWIFWFNDYLIHVKSHDAATGINKIVMFKSCYPNSDIESAGTEPGDPFDSTRTIANYKALYRHPSGAGNTYTYEGNTYQALEDIFAANPGTLFIPVTAPALVSSQTTKAHAANARAFNNWLKGEWLTSYNTSHPGLNNVMVFDWFDVLANPDDGSATANMQKAAYISGDPSHPNDVANAYSTTLFATNTPNFIDTTWAAFNGSQTPYDITMAVSPAGAGTTTPAVGGPHSLTSPQGITATAAAGQVFSGWTTTAGLTAANPNSAATTLTFTAAGTATANFVAVPATATLTMAVTPDGSGTTNPATGAHTVNTEEDIAITAIPAAGYSFVIWTSSGSITIANPASASTTANLANNGSATANFALTPTTPFITCGSVLTVYTGDLHDSEGNAFPDEVFTYKPSAWGAYSDPFSGADKSASMGVAFQSSQNFFSGEWKKAICLLNKKGLKQHSAQTAAEYLPELQQAQCTIVINEKIKDMNRQTGYYTSGDANLVPPTITVVQDSEGATITNAQPGATIYIGGYYFSTKNPTVWLEYPVVKGEVTTIKALKCKVQKNLINEYTNAKEKFVCMDPATGESRLPIQIPTKFPKDYQHYTIDNGAQHNIVIENGIGRATTPFTTVDNNTAICVLTMAVSPANGGTTSPAVGVHNVNAGQAQAIIATPSTGYTFVNWTATANAALANANSASTTATLSGDATVTANFQQSAQQVVLTMAVLPANGGTTSPAVGAHNVNAGQAQAIIATPSTGYTFVNWTATANAVLANANSASTTATLSAAATVTANFQVQQIYTLVSSTFTSGANLPLKCATVNAGGQNISPNLKWSNVPAGTLSFAITCIDKLPGSDWGHWMVLNVPSSTSEIAENASNVSMPSGSLELNNDYGYKGYGGPEPPAGSGKHPYVFTVYALDQATFTPSSSQLSEADFLSLINGHILGQVSITGYFEIP